MSDSNQRAELAKLRAVFERVVSMIQQGRPDEAELIAKEILNNNPNEPNLLRVLGVALMRQGKLEEAKINLETCVKLTPQLAGAHEQYGAVLCALGEVEEAERAFRKALQEGKGVMIHEMYERWPFFRMIMGMLEMVLAKSDTQIAAYYERRLAQSEDKPLGQELRARLDEMVDLVKAITAHSTLLQNNNVIRRSIEVRNPYLDPLHMLQVELMRVLRQKQAETPQEARALMITVAGIAAGMRNTG